MFPAGGRVAVVDAVEGRTAEGAGALAIGVLVAVVNAGVVVV